MKMKEREVLEHCRELNRMGHLVLPSKLSFAISCNLEKLTREADRVEKERTKLCRRYADKGEDGDPVTVDSVSNGEVSKEYKMTKENRELFGKEYDAVLDTEIEIEIRSVKMEEVERCEAAERYSIPTVAQIRSLSFMLEM